MIFRSIAVVMTLLVSVELRAQDTTATLPAVQTDTTAREAPRHVMVGSDDENYLRYLQDAGLAAAYTWSLREFSQKELAAFSVRPGSHPRSGKGEYSEYPAQYSFKILPVNVVFRLNTAFPYGSNDGAVWAGRGLTSATDLGFAFRAGPLSATINPIAFRSENTAFELQATGTSGAGRYADPLFPADIDRPQRFGNSPYSRIDLGESTVRLDVFGISAGVSTANMGWGPMELYPYILGANAPGFPHAFVGTSTPFPIGIGHLHGRVVWGRLDQSAYSPVTGTAYYSSVIESGTRRFMSGAVAIFEPRGVPGLEIGVARFFHSVWPRTGIPREYLTKPFEGILKGSLRGSAGFASGSDVGVGDNQLASAFFRWLFPSSGFETYGEYGRDDHSADVRDLVQEPDHSRTFGLGLRKTISSDSARLSGFRAEFINYETPTLARHRSEGGIYIHTVLRQGHTNRGQLLGADAGAGTGGAYVVAWDSWTKRGRITYALTRTIRQQTGIFYIDGVVNPHANDVLYAATAERSRGLRIGECALGITLIREFNRSGDGDAWNLNSTLRYIHSF